MKIINKIEDKTVFGIELGLSNKGTLNSDFTNIRKDIGYATFNDELQSYQLPGITEIDDSVVIFSESLNIDATPLFKEDFSLLDVKKLIEFYLLLKEKHNLVQEFSANLIYTYEDGILILPPKLINFINERESLFAKLNDVSIYRHPDLKGEKSFLFSLGILLFKATTKLYPIEFSDVEDLRDKMRRKRFLEPRWKNINISDELNNLIMSLFDIENDLTLESTSDKLNNIVANGINREESDYSQEILTNSKKEKFLLNFDKKRALFIKHRGLIIGLSLGLFLILIFFGSILSNALKPPHTAGFTQEQVVETYFASFQVLDPELVDDVLGKGVRNNDSTEISTLYVTTKMRTQTDPKAKLLSPKEWLTLSDEDKSNGDVYGIYDLKIEDLGNNRFKVFYEKWYTQADDGDLNKEVVMGVYKLYREEIFTLTETKYSYEITNIETLVEKSDRIW